MLISVREDDLTSVTIPATPRLEDKATASTGPIQSGGEREKSGKEMANLKCDNCSKVLKTKAARISHQKTHKK